MDKPKINYYIDLLAGISLFITAFTGMAMKIFLPSGVNRGAYQELWGFVKSDWQEVHDWFGILFVVFVLVHLIVHYDWIICMTKSFFEKNTKNN